MGLPDPHDTRTFTHFAKLHPNGSVAAIVEVADNMLTHFDPGLDGSCYVDVTELKRSAVNLYTLTIDPAVIAAADPIEDRFTVSNAFRAALVKALPDALVDAVFGPLPNGK